MRDLPAAVAGARGDRQGAEALGRRRDDVPEHAAEDVAVKRPQAVPVDEPEQARRIEDGGLGDGRAGALAVLRNLELQPGTPRHPHLCHQPEQPIALERERLANHLGDLGYIGRGAGFRRNAGKSAGQIVGDAQHVAGETGEHIDHGLYVAMVQQPLRFFIGMR